jgi:hypothetical protein
LYPNIVNDFSANSRRVVYQPNVPSPHNQNQLTFAVFISPKETSEENISVWSDIISNLFSSDMKSKSFGSSDRSLSVVAVRYSNFSERTASFLLDQLFENEVADQENIRKTVNNLFLVFISFSLKTLLFLAFGRPLSCSFT